MEFLIFVILGTALVLYFAWKRGDNKRKKMGAQLAWAPNFEPTQRCVGVDGNSGIAIDEAQNKIRLVVLRNGQNIERIVSHTEIVSCELFEDGLSVTRTVRTSQVAGAIVGGLAFGGVGALVGGLTGKSETTGKVRRMELRIIVNDTQSPVHDVLFLGVPLERSSLGYKQALEKARHWSALLEVLIKRAEAEVARPAVPKPEQNSNRLVADELKKLLELRNAGVLTEAEFQAQKVKLLN